MASIRVITSLVANRRPLIGVRDRPTARQRRHGAPFRLTSHAAAQARPLVRLDRGPSAQERGQPALVLSSFFFFFLSLFYKYDTA